MGRARQLLAAVTLLATAGFSVAQAPDVRIRVDLLAAQRLENGGRNTLRFYNAYGEPGTVQFTFFLEPGLRAYVAQRLERIRGGGDSEFLDEAFVEDQGIWRVGKQYLPFGYSRLFQESVPALRIDNDLIIEGLPVAMAVADGGNGFARGVVLRVGGRNINASGFLGRNFGTSGSVLGLVRYPEDAPGKGFGWRQGLGASLRQRIGTVDVQAETLFLTRGEGPGTGNLTVVDVAVTGRLSKGTSFTLGFTRVTPTGLNLLRGESRIELDRQLSLEPMIRFNGSRFQDATIALRFVF